MHPLFTKIAFSTLFLFGISLSGFSETASLNWENRQTDSCDLSDRFHDMSALSGGFVMVGYTTKPGNYRDFLTVRVNANGDTLWVRTKNGSGSGNDEALLVRVDASNNIYVAGFADGGNSQDDIYILKYDINGTLLWDTTWNNSNAYLDDEPVDMGLDAVGNLLICGNTEPDQIAGNSDIVTLKIAPNGALLWQQIYTRPNFPPIYKDEAAAISIGASGDAYVCGRSANLTDDDYVTFRCSGQTGAMVWSTPIIFDTGCGDNRATDIVVNASETFFYVTGRSDNCSDDEVRTFKYSTAGLLQWTRFYNSAFSGFNDRGLFIGLDAAENVYVGGQTETTLQDYDFLLLKYNSAGAIQWARTVGYSASQDDIPSSMVVDAQNRICLTGYSDHNPNALVDDEYIMTAGWNDAGTALFTPAYVKGTRSNGTNEGECVISDPVTGNFMVAGVLDYITTQKDAALISYSVSGTQNWLKTYDYFGDCSSSMRRVVADQNRSVSVGYAVVEGNERDALLRVINNSGATVCQLLFNGSNDEDDEFNDVAFDRVSSAIYAVGYTKTIDQKSNFLLVKYNPITCDTVWTRQYNDALTNQTDRAVSLAVDASGNIYITGRSDSNPNDTLDNNDIVTLKYSTSGTVLWDTTFNGTGNLRDEPVKLLLDNAGAVVVAGRTENVQNDDILALKYEPSTGSLIWTAQGAGTYNSPLGNDDRAIDMAIDASNNVFVCGYSQTSQGITTNDGVVAKFDATTGNLLNAINYDGLGSGNDQAEAIVVTASGEPVVSYHSDTDSDPNISNYDMVTFKYSNDLLNEIWSSPSIYDGPVSGDELPVAMVADVNGDIYLTGVSEFDISGGVVNNDILLLKYASNGSQVWAVNYDGPSHGDDESNGLWVNDCSAIFVAGNSESAPRYQSDGITLRYSCQSGLSEWSGGKSNIRVYPNPASGNRIYIDTQGYDVSNLEVLDARGALLVSKKDIAVVQELSISDWPKGVYLIRLIGDDFQVTRKLIIE